MPRLEFMSLNEIPEYSSKKNTSEEKIYFLIAQLDYIKNNKNKIINALHLSLQMIIFTNHLWIENMILISQELITIEENKKNNIKKLNFKMPNNYFLYLDF